VDIAGGPVIDPTENVIALTEAANQRQDDLREATKELSEVLFKHQKEMMDLRAENLARLGEIRESHQRELDTAESNRLNSIRQVDREEVAKTAAAAQTAISTLATTTNTMAETLRTQVANTAAAAENRQVAFATDMNKRLSAVELALSEGKGKQQVSDPQIERMAMMVEKLVTSQSNVAGKSEGGTAMWGYVAAGFAFMVLLIGLATGLLTLFFMMKPLLTK